MQSILKQIAETKSVSIDFSPVLSSGETITLGNATVTVIAVVGGADATSTIYASGTLAHASGVLTFRINAGTADTVYKITVKTGLTSTNNVHEEDVTLIVSEDINILYTVDELKANLNITDTSKDGLLFGLVRSSSAFIENSLDRVLSYKTYTTTFYPEQISNFLILPAFPADTVTSIVIDGTTLDASTGGIRNWVLDTEGVIRRVDGGTFPKAPYPTVIEFTAGFPVIPEDIRMAVKKLATAEYSRRLRNGVLSESIGDYKIVFEKQSILEDPIISSVLSRYSKRIF